MKGFLQRNSQYTTDLGIGITFQDILGSSLSVHKMMFQNLPPELRQNVGEDDTVQVSTGAIADLDDETGMNYGQSGL